MKVIYYPPAKYIYQTDPEFFVPIPEMRPSGCFFLSIVEALCGILGVLFTHEMVIRFFKREIGDGDIDVNNEMTVGKAQDLIDDFIEMNGIAGAKFKYYDEHMPASYVCADDEVEWGCWHKLGKSYNHFTHNNGKGIVLYDPWSADGSESVRYGELVSKRVARVLALPDKNTMGGRT